MGVAGVGSDDRKLQTKMVFTYNSHRPQSHRHDFYMIN
jgi:hypothetical protein